MAKDDMQEEIDALRAQVAELTAEREASAKQQAQASGSTGASEEPRSPDSNAGETTAEQAEVNTPEPSDLGAQFQELMDVIDEEIKAANPVTVLVVFALGVLLGRLLPR